MGIDIVPPPELGEKYPATIWMVKDPDRLEKDNGPPMYGEQIQVLLVETNGNMLSRYLPVPATIKNRTGRILTSLMGTYPTGTFDEQVLVGMTVDVVYAQKKGGNADELVIDLFKPRKPGKDEDPAATVAAMIEKEEQAAPF